MPNLDEIAKLIIEKWELLAALTVILSGTGASIAGFFKWQHHRRQIARLRQLPTGDFPFEVIKPRSPDLLKQIMGGDDQNPLADYKIPYQERQPDRNVRQELETAFTEKNWVLILGKSGLGKTREAAHLAEVMNQEGWTVLKLAEQPGEWLDVPKAFPSEISPDDKLLFFLDDLNRWMYVGNPHEMHPKAGEDLARPLREPVQERLPRLLCYFEQQGKSPYVRVIATARNEREPDKPGEISPWDKLQWEKHKSFWQQFQCYSLEEPSKGAIVSLLTDCVAAAGLRGVPTEYAQIARRNDGTFRNITLNLDSAQNRDLAVNNQEFSPRLDQTWRQRYNKVVQRYPLASHVYDAVELLQTLNLELTPAMLVGTTQLLLPGRGVRRWWQSIQLLNLMAYLATTEQILKPKDGQIEAKKTSAVNVGDYAPRIIQLLDRMAKLDPVWATFTALMNLNPAYATFTALMKLDPAYAAFEYFKCGTALFNLGRYQVAITSFDRALAIKPGDHEAWNNRGVSLHNLGRYEEAISSYDQALAIKPDDHEVWYNRGVSLHNLERYEAAISSYDQAVTIKPDFHEAWNSLGNSLFALKCNEEAISSYSKAVAIKPDCHEAWNNQGAALEALGQNLQAQGQQEEALVKFSEGLTAYDQALAIKPGYPDALDNKGYMLKSLGRNEDALATYDLFLAIKPDHPDALCHRGDVLLALGRNKEAIASYDQAVAIKPDLHEAWGNRGIALTALGRYEEALVSYNRVLEIQPTDTYAIYKKAACYSMQGDMQKAVETLQHAITLDAKYREMAKTDSDVDAIRDDPRFQALIQGQPVN